MAKKKVQIPTAAALARKTHHNPRTTRARMNGDRAVTAGVVLEYLRAICPKDEGSQSWQVVAHFAALESLKPRGFPDPTDEEQRREDATIARAEAGKVGEITHGPVPGRPSDYQVCETTDEGPGEIRRFKAAAHAAAYARFLRTKVAEASPVPDNPEPDGDEGKGDKGKAEAEAAGANGDDGGGD